MRNRNLMPQILYLIFKLFQSLKFLPNLPLIIPPTPKQPLHNPSSTPPHTTSKPPPPFNPNPSTPQNRPPTKPHPTKPKPLQQKQETKPQNTIKVRIKPYTISIEQPLDFARQSRKFPKFSGGFPKFLRFLKNNHENYRNFPDSPLRPPQAKKVIRRGGTSARAVVERK